MKKRERKKAPYWWRLIRIGFKSVWYYVLFPTDLEKARKNREKQKQNEKNNSKK